MMPTFPRFLDLPSELQLLIAEQLPLKTSYYLFLSCRKTYELFTESTYLPLQAAKRSLFPPYSAFDSRSPLHHVAATNNAPLLAQILKHCARIGTPTDVARAVNRYDTSYLTPLISAIAAPTPMLAPLPDEPPAGSSNARAETVKLLLRHGAESEPECLAKQTEKCATRCGFQPPLFWAVVSGDHAVMALLLEAGAYVDTAPAHWFAEFEPFEWDPLFEATIRRDAVAVEIMLRMGRMKDDFVWTCALQHAIDYLKPHIMELVCKDYVVDYHQWDAIERVFRAWLGEEKWATREIGVHEWGENELYNQWQLTDVIHGVEVPCYDKLAVRIHDQTAFALEHRHYRDRPTVLMELRAVEGKWALCPRVAARVTAKDYI